MRTMTLTKQQQEAMAMITAFLDDAKGQVFILKGYAGTGKTTLAGCLWRLLMARKRQPYVMAPTGRAAKVLRSTIEGCLATTIHKSIYDFAGVEIDKDKGTAKTVFEVEDKGNNVIYIIDEASMISSRKQEHELLRFGSDVLLDDILTSARTLYGGKIIFIGDPAQLPPVGDNRSAALDEAFFKEKDIDVRSYTLTDVVRQAKESAVLNNATTIRNMLITNERNSLVIARKAGEVDDLGSGEVPDAYCDDATRAAIVCYSNKKAAEYNRLVRSILFPGMPNVAVGDRLMVVHNSYHGGYTLLNGEMITVTEVSDDIIKQGAPVQTDVAGEPTRIVVTLNFRKISFLTDDGYILSRYIIDSLLNNDARDLTIDEMRMLYPNFRIRMGDAAKRAADDDIHAKLRAREGTMEFAEALANDQIYNALHVKYGYAVTCHKAQGGEWDTVYVDFDGRNGLDDDSLRWKYTAVTRTKKRLVCVNLIDITPMSRLKINAITTTSRPSNDALAFGPVAATPFHDSSSSAAARAKYWSVRHNMDECGGGYSIVSVQPKPFRDIYSICTPAGGTVRVDAVYNKAGIFTKYDMSVDDVQLRRLFTDEGNMTYVYSYVPELESLQLLHSHMVSLCDEIGITITNVVARKYQVAYYLKTTGTFASLSFFYDSRGFITYGNPLSDIGTADAKLKQLIDKLQQ